MLFSPPLWSLFVLLAAVLCGSVAPGQDPFPSVGPLLDNPFGFETTNKKARCFEGSIPVFVNTTNTHLLLDPSPSQPDVTEIFQELFQVNSDIVVRNSAGAYIVTGNFNIATTLCYPESSNSTTSPATVQVLGHGVGLDRSYWDISPSNSYVEAAAEAGYATLAFDRLGVGDSDKPDPINVVQANVHVEVLFNLAKGLRNGQIGLKPFKNVVGVGSSFGGIVQIGANAKYPTAFDAVVISSVSDTLQYLPYTIYSNTPARARDEPSGRFSKLPGAYLVDPTEISFQQPFFRYPFYDQSVFNAQYASKGTYTLGDEFTLASIFSPAEKFTGPVDIVLGAQDFPFCFGDCLSPDNRAEAALSLFYPSANKGGSQTFIVENTGHLINDHSNAGQSYEHINSFLKTNGL